MVSAAVQCGGGASADATTPSGGGSGQFDPICTNGVESTEKVSTANTEKCVSCDPSFDLNGELCRPFNFICPNGVPLTGKAPGKGIEKCTSCDDYYALKSDKTCAEVTVTTLAGGNEGGTMGTATKCGTTTRIILATIGESCKDGMGTDAKFSEPAGVAVNSLGNIIYVADRQNHRIRKITSTGTVSLFAGTGAVGGMDDMPGMPGVAQFYQPEGVAVDSDGFVYVADSVRSLIRKITPPSSGTGTGTVITLAGGNVSGVGGMPCTPPSSGCTKGMGTDARFSNPYGVAVDGSGNVLYVADTVNDRIRKITSTGTVTTFAGGGSPAQFNTPVSVAVDSKGFVYVADRDNDRIQKITPGGVVTTLAGGGSGNSDGVGTSAKFNKPSGVAVDSKGFVYVADRDNDRIRKITPDGVVTTLAGGGSGSSDGTGTSVQFKRPEDVAVDKLGNVYVADTGNHRIRKITITQ